MQGRGSEGGPNSNMGESGQGFSQGLACLDESGVCLGLPEGRPTSIPSAHLVASSLEMTRLVLMKARKVRWQKR